MKKRLLFSLSLMGYIGIATALPLVVLAIAGKYIDSKYDSSPKFLVIFILLAAMMSFFILRNIVSKAIEQSKEIQ